MYYREKSHQVEVYPYHSLDNTRFQAKHIETFYIRSYFDYIVRKLEYSFIDFI